MGWGMNSSNMHTSKLDKYAVLDTLFKLDWSKRRDKEYVAVKLNSVIQTAVHFFFFDLSGAQNMVWVIEGKMIQKWSEGKQKLLQVSGSFKFSRVWVTKGKIAVNLWRKSSGNRFD